MYGQLAPKKTFKNTFKKNSHCFCKISGISHIAFIQTGRASKADDAAAAKSSLAKPLTDSVCGQYLK
jgi:hypothetical protein